MYCPCSNNFLVYFSPLYLYPSAGPISGALVFQPGTMSFLNYTIFPTSGVIGSYTPGVQACFIPDGDSCSPVPSLGVILPFTGSSLPGGGITSSVGSAALGVAANVGANVAAGAVTGVINSSLNQNTSPAGNSQTSQNNQGNQNQSNQNPANSPIQYSSRLVITKGGTYTGNWESADAQYSAVEVKTSEPVTIINSNIRSKGNLINSAGYHANITVINTNGYGENPDVNMKVPGRFLAVQDFSKIVVQNNYLESTRGIYIQGPKNGAGTIQINNNRVKNIDGRLSAGAGVWRGEDIENYWNSSAIDVGGSYGQFVQLNTVNSADVEIGWNEVINEPGKSRAEDVISIYKSSGTSGNPIDIHDNYIAGAFPLNPATDNFTGGGIMAGDNVGSSNVVVENNSVISTTNYGIAASAGSHILFLNNRVIASGKLPSGASFKYNPNGGNVGLAIFRGYNTPLSNISAFNNTIGWTKANGSRNDWYIPEVTNFTGNKRLGLVSLQTESDEFTLWQKKLADNAVTIGPQ